MAPKGQQLPPPGPSASPNSREKAAREQFFSLRPSQSTSSHKTFLRISLHPSVLANLDLKAGGLCCVHAAPTAATPLTNSNGSTEEKKSSAKAIKAYPALAWPASDPHITGKVALVSESIREMLRVGFEHKVLIGKYIGKKDVDASEVFLIEVAGDGSRVTEFGWEMEGEGWRYMVENALVDAKYAYEDMVLATVTFKGVKRNFKVRSINASGSDSGGGTGGSHIVGDKIIVSAFRTSVSTVAAILPSSPAGLKRQMTPTPEDTAPYASPIPLPTSSIPKRTPSPGPTFAQIGGLTTQLTKLNSVLLATFHHFHRFTSLNLTPFRGILLHGPPGTGKSLIMRCLPASLPIPNIKTFSISGSIVGPYAGESEASLRKIFKEAKENQPSIIFMDEIDAIAPKRSSETGVAEHRLVAALITELDELGRGAEKVLFVAATNRPNKLDEGLRRPGRLDSEIEIPRPDAAARFEILRLLLSKANKGWINTKEDSSEEEKQVEEDAFIRKWAGKMHGYVGADMEAVVRIAVLHALGRLNVPLDTGEDKVEEEVLVLRDEDIDAALTEVRPTSMREVIFELPNVRWTDIGGQEEIKQRLREAVELPLTHPEVFVRLGGTPRKGFLLYGPPGCSKTLTAKALATEAGLNFMAVKGPELLNMYVGESERAVREVFRKARAARPSIIFFDEIDALGRNRTDGPGGGGGGGGANVLTALLNEMDGIEALTDVTILAATNRPEQIDPALMRPGRLDTILYVGPPDLEARREILKIKTRKMSIHSDIDLEELAVLTEGYSGAELVNICDEATHYAMRESLDIEAVGRRHFDIAREKSVRQITPQMKRFYEEWSVGGVRKIS